MKKVMSGLLALIFTLGLCAGCGAEQKPDEPQTAESIYAGLTSLTPSETVLEIDGNTVPAELYLYWLTYSCGSLEYQLNMFNAYYGMYGELFNEDGALKWDGDLEGSPLSQVAKEQAEGNALSYAVLENVAAAHGVTLTGEDRAAMETDLASYIESQGGQEAFEESLWEMGLSRESFDRVSAITYLYQHLAELAQDPSSDLYQAPSDDNAYVDHILLMTIDSETREPLSEEEIQAKRDRAEELLAQLQAAADVETLFTQLAEENGEDPGRLTETGYLIDPDTNFVQEFKDAAFALKPGEISGIVESDYGYHILLRKELTEDQLATLAADHLSDYLDERMEEAMDKAVRSEKLEEIDAGAFYTGYQAAVEALHPQEDQDGTDGEGAVG